MSGKKGKLHFGRTEMETPKVALRKEVCHHGTMSGEDGLDTKRVAEHTLGLWLPLGSRTVIGVVQSFWQARQESAQSSRVGICVSM